MLTAESDFDTCIGYLHSSFLVLHEQGIGYLYWLLTSSAYCFI
jgi:hypothetical protein